MAKQFKMFDNTGKGFVTFDDLMAAARSWNLDPTQQVCDLVRKSWLKAENLDSGVIEVRTTPIPLPLLLLLLRGTDARSNSRL